MRVYTDEWGAGACAETPVSQRTHTLNFESAGMFIYFLKKYYNTNMRDPGIHSFFETA